MLRIFTAEVLEGQPIGCVEVSAEIDPVVRFQRAINIEDFSRAGLNVRSVLHRHVEVGIPPLEIFVFREQLNRTVAVPEAVGRRLCS